ncbi:MAG: hypothetical protein WC765_04165 [Phycisphaerae bacterium]|jgi:hypothetical protein
MKSMLSAIVLAWIVLAGGTVTAEELAYPVFPLEQAPSMDGQWNDPAWASIPEAAGFISVKNGRFVSMRQTAFKIGRHADNLYIAVKCEEPEPDKVKTDVNNYRDGWYPDDNLEFLFSQDKEPKGFKQFVTNSRGARWTNFASPNAGEAWQSAAYKGGDFWSVEIKIPFSQLGIGEGGKAAQFWFNLARSANSNPNDEKFSSFASVLAGFADVENFASMTFQDAPDPEELAQSRKRLNRLGNWRRDRLWKIANVKEAFLVDKQADDNVRRLLALKQLAKKMLESKNPDGTAEFINQYGTLVAEINVPTKRLVLQVQKRDANTKLYVDGKELQPDASGKYTAVIKEGVSVFAAECASSGGNPAVRIAIEGMPESESRWKVSAHEEKGWLLSTFNDARWSVPALEDGKFLWADQGAAKIYLRQVILWNNAHDGDLRCILPLVREWGFSENSTETLFLALYSPLAFLLDDYEFQFDLPEGFELLGMNDSTHEGNRGAYKINCRPENVTKVPVEHQGVKYNRYVIKYPKGGVPQQGAQKPAFYSLLPVKLNKWNSDKTETCFFYARRACGNVTEIETRLPVRILPRINGRMLKKIMIEQYCGTPYFGAALSDQHLEEHIKTAISAGFNYWQVQTPKDKSVNMLVQAKVPLISGQNFSYPIWGNRGMQGSLLNLLKNRPEFQAKYFNNTSAQDKIYQRYCPSYVTIGEGRSAFKDAVKEDFKEKVFGLIPQAEIVWLNWESQSWQLAGSHTKAQKGDESYCFCDRCKKAFREFANLPANKQLTDEEIFTNYYKQWAAFRSNLDGDVEGIVNEVCTELGKKYYLYHGAADHTFWEACKGKIEHAIAGLPGNAVADSRVQQYMDDTMEFFRTKVRLPRIVGQRFSFFGPVHSPGAPAGKGCIVLSADGYVDAKSWKSQIVRLVATTHEGVDLQSSVESVAGMFYYIGEATRLIAEYEDLFYEGKRDEILAASEQLKYPNLLVLTKGDERLILLFNETDKPIKVELNNSNLKKGQKASVFGSSAKFGSPDKMNVTVNAGDVAAVHIE